LQQCTTVPVLNDSFSLHSVIWALLAFSYYTENTSKIQHPLIKSLLILRLFLRVLLATVNRPRPATVTCNLNALI